MHYALNVDGDFGWINLTTGEQGSDDYWSYGIGEPFIADYNTPDETFYWHAPEDGHMEVLLTPGECDLLGIPLGREDALFNVHSVSIVGDWLYFSIDYGTHFPEEDIGWWWAHEPQATYVCRKNRKEADSLELIYSYNSSEETMEPEYTSSGYMLPQSTSKYITECAIQGMHGN